MGKAEGYQGHRFDADVLISAWWTVSKVSGLKRPKKILGDVRNSRFSAV
jgi:hypothetical protein